MSEVIEVMLLAFLWGTMLDVLDEVYGGVEKCIYEQETR